MEDKILKNLKEREPKICVLATASSDGATEAAVVGYVVMDDLTMLISTSSKSRKVKNILSNANTSIVVGVSFSEMYIQMDGTAVIVSEGQEFEEMDTYFFTQNPGAANFKGPDTVFIKFSPHWMRYIDHRMNPSPSEEKTLS